VVFFRRHPNDDHAQRMPGREFLTACPSKTRATMRVVLAAAAPPKRLAAGGYREPMKAAMARWFEVRVDGPSRVITDCSVGSTTKLLETQPAPPCGCSTVEVLDAGATTIWDHASQQSEALATRGQSAHIRACPIPDHADDMSGVRGGV
jgi:hypothetical protein